MATGGEPSRLKSFLAAATRIKVPRPAGFDNASAEKRLERSLGVWDLILLGVGASIGSGIFVITGVAALDAGPAVTMSFALAGLACVVDALCYAELSARFPGVVGGAYMYAYAAFGELPAFVLFSHLMLDYHIGAASLARSLAGHLSTLVLQIFPPLASWLPAVLAPGGMPLFHGVLSINLLAPLLLAALTIILCRGVRESATLNAGMTIVKILIVLLVIGVGSTQLTPSNWLPFAPHGYKAVVTSASVVFFSYVGFDAVANTAEESRNPQRDLPIGILVSLAICALLYICVSGVITGMVPYWQLDPVAPLATAFISKGLRFVSGIIDLGAVVGLTTTLLAGLYVQSRLYMALARDGLLPPFLSHVNPFHHTPMRAQLLVGAVAGTLGGLYNVAALSHILSVGVLVSYSLVCVCVVMLRLQSGPAADADVAPPRWRALTPLGRWEEAAVCVAGLMVGAFAVGLTTHLGAPVGVTLLVLGGALLPLVPLVFCQSYVPGPGFLCPWVPVLPLVGMMFNIYLVAQMHVEAWIRLLVVSVVAVGGYALYGQHRSTAGYEEIRNGGESDGA